MQTNLYWEQGPLWFKFFIFFGFEVNVFLFVLHVYIQAASMSQKALLVSSVYTVR